MFNIPKGTWVTIRTTNGGESVGRLLSDYHPTYACHLEIHGRAADIPGWRVASVQRLGAVV